MADINEIVSKEAINDIVRLIQNFDTLETKITKINQTVTTYSDKQKQLNTVTTEADKIAKEEAKTLDILDKQRQKAYQAMAKEEAKQNELNKAHSNSIVAMERQNAEMNKQRKQLDVNSQEYQKLSQKMAANTVQLKAHDKEIGRSQMYVGNYGDSLKNLGSKLLALGAGFAAGIGAMQIFIGIMTSTDAAADFFKEQLSGLKEGFGFLARSIVNVDFTNLIQGFRDAFTEGKRYAQTLDEIENRQRALGIQKSSIEGEIIDQKIIARNRRLDLKDREAAVDKIVELEAKKLAITKETTQKAIANELENAATIAKVDKGTIQDFIANYDKYIDKIKEGAVLQEYLDSLVERVELKNGGYITNYAKRDEAIKNLNDTQKQSLKLLKLYNTLTDEKRDLIVKTLTADINAQNEEKSGIASLSKLRNSLYTELIKDEKEATITNEKENKKREILEEIAADKKLTIGKMKVDIDIDSEQVITDNLLKQLKIRENAEVDTFEADMEREKKKSDRIREEWQDRLNAANEIGQTMYDFGTMLNQNAMTDLDKKHNYELELAGDSTVKKEAADKKYDEARKKLMRKQAVQDKAMAIFKSTINFAQALIAALTVPPPASFVFEAITAALAGIQLGLVIGTKVPAFAKGGVAKKGLGRIGEIGKELIFGPDGSVGMSPGTSTLMNFKGGERIVSNRETELLMRMAKGADDTHSKGLMDRLHQDNRDLIRTIQNKKEYHFDEHGRKIGEREGAYFKNYRTKKITG